MPDASSISSSLTGSDADAAGSTEERVASAVRAGRKLEERLRERGMPLRELRRLWDLRDAKAWALTPGIYEALADDLRRRGEVFWSYDVATEGVTVGGAVARLRQLQALALADTGAPRAAQEILESLLGSEGASSETLAILARTHKDLARIAATKEEEALQLGRARRRYEEAFRQFRDYYPGINAAALALLAGEPDEARGLADQVDALCREEARAKAKDGREPGVWNVATRAEAALIRGEVAQAAVMYGEAVSLAGADLNVVASMRRQALQLAGVHGGTIVETLRDCFRLPPIIVFSGHRIDAIDRAVPRFPAAVAEEAKRRIGEILDRTGARIAFASAASGGDILFLEAMLERGGEIHIVLPMAVEGFRKSSVLVDEASICGWSRRFDSVLERAASITHASTQDEAVSDQIYTYANDLIFGLAIQRGRNLGAGLLGVAIWDGQPGAGPGSTADAVQTWRRFGCPVEVVDPLCSGGATATAGSGDAGDPRVPAVGLDPASGAGASLDSFEGAPAFSQEVKAILFADAVGFSQLTDRELPAYMRHFMGGVARLVERLPVAPLTRNTWGDAFHFVFDSVREAGVLALQLRDFVQTCPWREWGLARPLGIRIALHAGSVYSFIDPVTNRQNYLGYHVNRAARIEPIAEEGQIYASEPFAALAAFQAPDLLRCDYAGQRALAKGFGSDRIFIVRSRAGDGRPVPGDESQDGGS